MPPPLIAISGLLLLTVVFHSLSTVTVLTTVGALVGYIVIYRTCMFAVFTPLTAINVQILDPSQIRMGQGLLGVVRNIAGSLGVTITSVYFERRRAAHQLLAYDAYTMGSLEHDPLMHTLKHDLHGAGIIGGAADRTALGAIRRELDVEAVAAGLRDSFLLLSLYFILGCLPLVYITVLWALERRDARRRSKPSAIRV